MKWKWEKDGSCHFHLNHRSPPFYLNRDQCDHFVCGVAWRGVLPCCSFASLHNSNMLNLWNEFSSGVEILHWLPFKNSATVLLEIKNDCNTSPPLMMTFHRRAIGHFFACFQAVCLSARWCPDRLMIAQGWGGRGYYGSIQLAHSQWK